MFDSTNIDQIFLDRAFRVDTVWTSGVVKQDIEKQCEDTGVENQIHDRAGLDYCHIWDTYQNHTEPASRVQRHAWFTEYLIHCGLPGVVRQSKAQSQ